MKSRYLFPAWSVWLGLLLAIPGFILGYLFIFNKYQIPGFGFNIREKSRYIDYPTFENFSNELAVFLVIIGLMLVAFSEGKREDELNAKLRLNALYWSVMTYSIIDFIGLHFNYFIEIPFFGEHISVLNLFTPLVIFILRYYYLLYIKKDQYLVQAIWFLPNKPFKLIGVIITVISFIVCVFNFFSDGGDSMYSETLGLTCYFFLFFGLLLWAFSKQRKEDEMTMQQRLESLQLAIYFNYTVILLATIFVYSLDYLGVLMFAHFSILLFFVLRTEYINYKNKRSLNQGEGALSYEK